MSEVTIFPEDPYYLRLSENNIADHKLVIRTAFNPDLDTGAVETIWSGGGLYVFPTAASTMSVSSSSAVDSSAGAGARIVQIQGLNANYDEIQENIVLQGTSPVPTTLSYLRMNTAIVLSAGANENNAGDIWVGTGAVTSGVPANKYAHIPVSYNISQSSHYTIPRGWTGYNIDITGSAQNSTANQRTIIATRLRPQGGVFYRGGSLVTSGTIFTLVQTAFRSFDPKTDLDAIADTTDTNVWVTSIQRYVLIKTKE
jgi:hypothetical protein